MNPVERICLFIEDTDYSGLPDHVVQQVKRCILDWLGVAIGGSSEPCVRIGIETIKELGGEPQATIPVFGIRTSITNCAIILGMMSHALDYDDTHAPTLIHPSSPILSALVPLGEWKRASGRSLIEAYTIAYDITIRAGLALGHSHYARGWHATSTLGHIGAAAGAGKILGLDVNSLINAIALSATQAGGLRHVFGTMAKPFHPGRAASDALMASLLAEKGFTCSRDVIDGERGFFSIFAEEPNLDELVRGLGMDFKVMENTFKPHASCLLTHPTIDALIEIRRKDRFLIEEVEEIFCRVSRFCLDAAGKREPRTGLEGKFSLYFCSALALVEGRAGEDLFTDSMVIRPDLVDLSRKVRAEADPCLKETEAHVLVKMKDGTSLEQSIRTPKGDPKNKMTDDDLKEKFRFVTRQVLPKEKTERIIKILEGLEEEKDLERLITSCS